MADMGDVEGILSEMTPRTVKVRVLLRQDLLDEHAELEERLLVEQAADERENREPVAIQVAKQIAELEARIDDAKREFSFRSVGRAEWTTLVGKYPPTRDQLKQNRASTFDPLRLPAAAIAATSHEPKLTLDQAKQLEEGLPDAAFDALWGAVCQANIGSNDSPKSLAAGMTLRLNGASETTAPLEESLVASS